MGQKVNPIGFRIGVCFGWDSRWCVRDPKDYADTVAEDLAIRDFVKKNLASAEIGRVEIERAGDAVRVVLHSGRPGVVIGKKGQEIETLRQRIAKAVKSYQKHLTAQLLLLAFFVFLKQLKRAAIFDHIQNLPYQWPIALH